MRSVAALTETLALWADAAPDVRAVAIVGSHARGTARPDSDIDLIVLVDNVSARLHSREWLSCFGEPASVEHEDWGLVQSLRASYTDGLQVEFGLALMSWATPPIDSATAAVIRAGLEPVWDPQTLFGVASESAERVDTDEDQ